MKGKFNPGLQKYEPERPLKKGKGKFHISLKDKLIGIGIFILIITFIYFMIKFVI